MPYKLGRRDGWRRGRRGPNWRGGLETYTDYRDGTRRKTASKSCPLNGGSVEGNGTRETDEKRCGAAYRLKEGGRQQNRHRDHSSWRR